MVPPVAFSISAAQASAAGCIGCDGGTQWAKRHSTALSCAKAGPANSNAAASAKLLSCVIQSSLSDLLLSIITVCRRAAKAHVVSWPMPLRIIGGTWRALLPIRIGERMVLLRPHFVACLAEQRRRQAGEGRIHVDRQSKIGGDLYVLCQKPERKPARELARDDMLFDDVLGVEGLAGREVHDVDHHSGIEAELLADQ